MVAQPRYGQEWTLDDYLELERQPGIRHEFVGGRVYAMSGGTRRHDHICATVTALLIDHLGSGPCRLFTAGMKVRLADGQDHVYPDASVSCDDRDLDDEDAVYISHPSLVVEVLSKSTQSYDQHAKFDLYKTCDALQDYVLIHTTRQAVDVRTRDSSTIWTPVHYGPEDHIHLHSINLDLPVSSLYKGVTL